MDIDIPYNFWSIDKCKCELTKWQTYGYSEFIASDGEWL